MMDMMEDREVWRLNLKLLPPQPLRKSGQRRKKKEEGTHDKHCTNTVFQEKIKIKPSHMSIT